MNIYSFYLNFFLFNFVFNYSELKKNKAKACLIIFRLRMIQDSFNYKKIIESFSSEIENAEYKITMMSLTNCYSLIKESLAKEVLEKVKKKELINSLDEQFIDLISFDKIPNFESDEFAFQMEEFSNIYNEVSSEMQNDFNNNNNGKIYFYESIIFIIFIGFIFVFSMFFCYKMCFIKKTKSKNKKIN